ncbi:hypothetical protein F5Y07DRAFT_370849 [Xylaria sp. FL0933]|nr:hypothetical protein F5Y07DRAFT_370849 [Xylaria sp. FL0933]
MELRLLEGVCGSAFLLLLSILVLTLRVISTFPCGFAGLADATLSVRNRCSPACVLLLFRGFSFEMKGEAMCSYRDDGFSLESRK